MGVIVEGPLSNPVGSRVWGAFPFTRVPGVPPIPRRWTGDAPPRCGRDPITPWSSGRGRGPGSAEEQAGSSAPWAVLSPAGATALDLRTARAGTSRRQISRLPSQTWVSLVDDRPLSRLRLRLLARSAGLVIERELIVMPTLEAPAAVVEDVECAVRSHRTSLAAPHLHPTGSRTAWAQATVALLRVLPWSWTGWLVPGRVVLARRR